MIDMHGQVTSVSGIMGTARLRCESCMHPLASEIPCEYSSKENCIRAKGATSKMLIQSGSISGKTCMVGASKLLFQFHVSRCCICTVTGPRVTVLCVATSLGFCEGPRTPITKKNMASSTTPPPSVSRSSVTLKCVSGFRTTCKYSICSRVVVVDGLVFFDTVLSMRTPKSSRALSSIRYIRLKKSRGRI